MPPQLSETLINTLVNLPDDVLLLILGELKPYEPDLLHATHVNRHWRTLATQTPWLWRQIFCDWAKREMVPVEVAIVRSASADIALVGRYSSFRDILQLNRLRISSIRTYFSPHDDLEHIFALLTDGMPVLRTLRLVNSSNRGNATPLDWSVLNVQSVPNLRNFTTYGFPSVLETVYLPRLQITRYEVPFLADAGEAVIALLRQFPELEDLGVDVASHCDMKQGLSTEALTSLSCLKRLDFEAAEDEGRMSTGVLERLVRPAFGLPIPRMVVSIQSATDEQLVKDGQAWACAAAKAHRAWCGIPAAKSASDNSNFAELSDWLVVFSRGDIDQSGHDVPDEVFTLSLVTSGIVRTLYTASSQRIVQIACGIFGNTSAARVTVFGLQAVDILCSITSLTDSIDDLTLVLSRQEINEVVSMEQSSSTILRLPTVQKLCLRARPDEIVLVSTEELAHLLRTRLSTEQGWKPQLRTAGIRVVGGAEHLKAFAILQDVIQPCVLDDNLPG